jgi:RNA polymerase sigma-70 factor (ECF subfamily)
MTTTKSAIEDKVCRRRDLRGNLDACGEQILIRAAQAGRPGAIDELLVRHKDTLFRTAIRFTNNHEDAEDIVQEAMLRAFVNIDKFRSESRFGTWLISITKNSALAMKRKWKNVHWSSLDSRGEDLDSTPASRIADSGPTPEQEIIRREFRQIVRTALLTKSRMDKTVLQNFMNGSRLREIASSLGLTMGTTKSRLFRARQALYRSLAIYGPREQALCIPSRNRRNKDS